jgi:hypothetical protein
LKIHGSRREDKKKKGPQGYDEDNASLDKFCKTKAKGKEKNTRSTK